MLLDFIILALIGAVGIGIGFLFLGIFVVFCSLLTELPVFNHYYETELAILFGIIGPMLIILCICLGIVIDAKFLPMIGIEPFIINR